MDKKKILIVEDEVLVGYDLKQSLESSNYDVIDILVSGEDAIDKVGECKPDLILMDVVLDGDIDGIEAAKIIYEKYNIPVLFLTSHTNNSILDRAKIDGAYGYILKPFSLKEIIINIEIALYKFNLDKELKLTKEEAKLANKAKSDFLATMSHEIRTPMNAILGFSDILLGTDINDEQKEYIELIMTSAEALLSIINDILDFSRIESGNVRLEECNFSLREIIKSVENIMKLNALRKKLEFSVSINNRVFDLIYGDEVKLRQVLINLIGNAIKFTEKGYIKLLIDNFKENNEIYTIFSIIDTGIGIPSNKIEKLFQKFSQVDSSTSRKYGGSGLGLIISKNLIELMGGRIWFESQEGKGSIFHFILPVRNDCKEIDKKLENNNEKSVDFEDLSKFKKEIAVDVIDYFLSDYPKQIELIKDSILKEDFEQIKYLSHKFKGTVLNFGAKKLSKIAFEIEKKSKEKDLKNIYIFFEHLREEALLVRDELDKFKDTLN